MRHPHADLIKEWAEDMSRVVQSRIGDEDVWEDTKRPIWNLDFEYRFKPEPKPDEVQEWLFDAYSFMRPHISDPTRKPNLKLTFDGETGKLKAAEVISD